jgi:Ca-activated chloride channel homolog
VPPNRATTRLWLPYALAVVAGLIVIAAAYLIVSPASARQPRGACVPLEVSSSTDKNNLLSQLADRYNHAGRRFAGECATVTVHGLTSGKAMAALAKGWSAAQLGIPEPQVWLPSSSLWLDQLKLQADAAGRPSPPTSGSPSLASSPLVIAMPQPKADVMRRGGRQGWGEILGMSGDTGWSQLGHPEWGRFTFGKDNPTLSTSGLAATIATYYAAVGRSSDLTKADLVKPPVAQFVRRIEANVSTYQDDVVDLLRLLASADAAGAGAGTVTDLSAIVMQEALVYQYNAGDYGPVRNGVRVKPRVPLVALYPKEGTLNLDHPYVVLPSAQPNQRRAAADFLAFLQAGPQQRGLADIGFRGPQATATDALVAGVHGDASARNIVFFAPPNSDVIATILADWGSLRKKANILFVIDTSGSMDTRIGASDRFHRAIAAAADGAALLNSQDQVGLWSFSSETPQRPHQPYSQELALGPFRPDVFKTRLAGLHVVGGTALYATVRSAQRYLRQNYDPTRINAVVVLTDGKNEYSKDDDKQALLRDVAPPDPNRPVKVFCIAFDEESDFQTLDEIAKASWGKAFDARDPARIDDAFVNVVSNF